ncbi:hypothetical protein EJI00_24780 [Variovorax sp. DXTD-1]|nr:hypothetical protein EJI00_24780 [Variovorax sp. DXTD-1]
MKQPRIPVDFNEMLESDLVLLSQTDFRTDSSGATIHLSEGLLVHVYEEDVGDEGCPDNLIAQGKAEKRTGDSSWGNSAIWCCRIDGNGIRHESELAEWLRI